MSNSSLVDYVAISPNSNNPRNNKIKKITIHHMAGNLSVETCGRVFNGKNRQASSNYGIGSDGRVGMYVEEKNRAWTSSSPSNDNQAITIEVANDGGANTNWHVSDKALAKLIDLCVDICKRNGIASLNYTGDSSGNLTRHNMFANTTCPGPYLQSKFPYIASEVNKRLNATNNTINNNQNSSNGYTGKFKVGDKVIINGALYVSSTASSPSGSVSNKETIITRVAQNTAHPYNTTGDLGWMNEADIKLVSTSTQQSTPSQSNNDLLTIVKRTIRGDFGNQPERQKKIEALGYNYNQVRDQVNKNYANGTTRWDNVKLY